MSKENDAIKALECCASAKTPDDCESCPYKDSDEKCGGMKNQVLEVIYDYRAENEALRSYTGLKASEMEQYINGFIAGKAAGIEEMKVPLRDLGARCKGDEP